MGGGGEKYDIFRQTDFRREEAPPSWRGGGGGVWWVRGVWGRKLSCLARKSMGAYEGDWAGVGGGG